MGKSATDSTELSRWIRTDRPGKRKAISQLLSLETSVMRLPMSLIVIIIFIPHAVKKSGVKNTYIIFLVCDFSECMYRAYV